jgi:predicted metal-binding membrane protein
VTTSAAPATEIRDRLTIGACVALVTALAWTYLFYLNRAPDVMAGMQHVSTTSWSARDFIFAFAMWTVMMVGMMLPTAAPLLLLFARTKHGGRQTQSFTTLYLAFGYAAIWIVFSVIAATLQLGLHQAALLSAAMKTPSRIVASVVLVGAGAFQYTALKRACLVKCQTPLGFLMTYWRNGRVGAFRMGVRHGVFCVGCCWAVMLLLFVVGVMNLAWVALLAAFVLLEKISPMDRHVAELGGAFMIAFGVQLLFI